MGLISVSLQPPPFLLAPSSQANQSGETGHDRARPSCLGYFQSALTRVKVLQAAKAAVGAGSTKYMNHSEDGLSRCRRSIVDKILLWTPSGGQLGS